MICSNCGSYNPNGFTKCAKCGSALGASGQPATPSGQPSQPVYQQPATPYAQPQQQPQYQQQQYAQQQYQQQPQYAQQPQYQQQQYQQQYGQPVQYQQPPVIVYAQPVPKPPRQKNGLGVAGMVLGIVGVAFFWFPLFWLLLGIPGMAFSVVGVCKKTGPKGQAIAGLILCSILVLLAVIFIALGMSLSSSL